MELTAATFSFELYYAIGDIKPSRIDCGLLGARVIA
jgi:hypothetical protein